MITTNHAIGVVAHVDRAEQARRLARSMRGAYLSVDTGEYGCELNHRRVWEWLQDYPTEWTLVLEDDALPVPGFRDQVTKALQAAPTDVVSLYRGHNVNNVVYEQAGITAGEKADANQAHWILSDNLLHAVAVAIRTKHIPDMLAHTQPLPHNFPSDERIAHWARANKHRVAYSWPSLVDHADGETVILKHHRKDKLHRPKGRVAYRTGTRDTWGSETVNL